MSDEREMETSNEPLTLSQLEQLDWVQAIKQLIPVLEELLTQEGQEGHELGGPGEEGQPGGEAPVEEGAEAPVEGEEGPEAEGPPAEGQEAEEELEEGPVRHSAGYPGPMNTHVPVTENVRMKRNSDQIRFARLEQEALAAREELRQMKIQLARSHREVDLLSLQASGVELDLEEELETVAPSDGSDIMDEARYQKHLDKIRTRYRRGPVNPNAFNFSQIGVTGDEVESEDQQRARMEKAVAEAGESGDVLKFNAAFKGQGPVRA